MIGECYNMKTNNIRYGHIMICPLNIPYYNIDSKLKRVEQLNSNDFKKYISLNEANIKYKPDMLSFNIINFNTEDRVLPNPDLVRKMDGEKRDKILDNIKNNCDLLYDNRIDKNFDLITSNYLKNSSLIKSLDKYMDTIEKDNAVYKSAYTNGKCDDNILDNRNEMSSKKKVKKDKLSFIDRIIQKFKK